MKKIKTKIGMFLVMIGIFISQIGYKMANHDLVTKYLKEKAEKVRSNSIKKANTKFWG